MAEADHEQRAPTGYTYGFWRLPKARLADSEWDTAWICETNKGFCRLPERNLAKQHGGWGLDAEAEDDEQESKDSSTEPGETSHSNHFPYPALSLPPPTVEFGFRVAVRFAPKITETVVEDGKKVRLAKDVCGTWSGSLGSGFVVAGGHDLDSTKLKTQTSHKVDTVFKLHTDDDDEPAILEMGARGFLSGPPDILHQTAHRSGVETRVDPRRYSYRMFINLTTADERYIEKVRGSIWVGSGMWDLDELVIDAYRVV